MWRLTEHLSSGARDDDRGVATIFLIISMFAIFVGAALAIDVGRYAVEARSAQNSADATVLAVATDCALDLAPADYTPYRKDGQTITSPTCGDGTSTITVTKSVGQTFLQQSAGDVTRSATAKWGTLRSATTIPLVVARCEFQQAPPSSSTDVIIHLPDPKKQSGCASGPGGFGQLDSDDDCSVVITAQSTATGKPGNDLQKQIKCITNPTAPILPRDILIPVFDETKCPPKGCQGNDAYPIVGFAAFRLRGFSFGPRSGGAAVECDKDVGKNCMVGNFVEFLAVGGTPGPSEDFGVDQVYLSD